MKLSAIIIAKNEEKNIERALKSVQFADERIVIDSNSTDRTAEIARTSGAKVYDREFKSYGDQKNYGASQAGGEWLLFIDADEEVTPELATSIRQVVRESEIDFYWFKIVTVFLGKPLKHMHGHNPRLMKNGSGRWTLAAVHEQVADNSGEQIKLGDNKSEVLNGYLAHHSHPDLKSYLKKMHKYTTLDARQMKQSGRHRSGRNIFNSWWLPIHLSVRQFIKLLLYRQGILDGWQGFMWCVMSAYYEWEMARKYLALIKV